MLKKKNATKQRVITSFGRVRQDMNKLFSWTQYNAANAKQLQKRILKLEKELAKIAIKLEKASKSKKELKVVSVPSKGTFVASKTAAKVHKLGTTHAKRIKEKVLYASVEDAVIDGKQVCSCAV